MKKSFIVIGAICFIWSFGFLTAHYKIFPYNQLKNLKNIVNNKVENYSPYYYHKVSFFEQFLTDGEIVMIGDSITDGADWNIMFPQKKILNFGIGGDTTDGILNRLSSVCDSNPKKVFIMVGINDFSLGYDVEVVYSNYEKIIKRLQQCNTEPFIQSTILGGAKVANLNNDIDVLNQKLQQLAKIKNIEYIDLNKKLAPKKILNSEYTLDDVHLNGKGYKMWQSTIEKYIQ